METLEGKLATDTTRGVSMEQLARDIEEIARHVVSCCQCSGVGISADLYRIAQRSADRNRETRN